MQAQILRLLLDLRETTGMTLLLITHDMGIVAQLADSVTVMYSGSLVECSEVASLFKAARHPYSQALLEAVPSILDGRDRPARDTGRHPGADQSADGLPFPPALPARRRCVRAPQARADLARARA